jgi:WD40 repeat protein
LSEHGPGRVGGFDCHEEKAFWFPTRHEGAVRAMAMSPDGQWIVSAGTDRLVKCWEIATRQERLTLAWHTASVTCLAFSPDGQTLASGGCDGRVRLWPWRELLALQPTGAVRSRE